MWWFVLKAQTKDKNTWENESYYQGPKGDNRSLIRRNRWTMWVSIASIHRIVTTRDKAPENRRHLSGRRRKLNPEHEASIVRSISKLREREGSFSSRRLMEQTGIRHVSYRTVRCFLNRNGYFFLQTGKKCIYESNGQIKESGVCQKDAS